MLPRDPLNQSRESRLSPGAADPQAAPIDRGSRNRTGAPAQQRPAGRAQQRQPKLAAGIDPRCTAELRRAARHAVRSAPRGRLLHRPPVRATHATTPRAPLLAPAALALLAAPAGVVARGAAAAAAPEHLSKVEGRRVAVGPDVRPVFQHPLQVVCQARDRAVRQGRACTGCRQQAKDATQQATRRASAWRGRRTRWTTSGERERENAPRPP